MKILLLNIFLSLNLTGYTQNSQSEMKKMENTEESQIIAVTQLLTQLMIDENTTDMNKILDANFTLTHITGYVQPKEEWFSEIQSERMKYYSAKELKNVVKITGNQAEIINQNLLDARIWGTRNTWRLQQTIMLEKRSGKWVILKSVATTF